MTSKFKTQRRVVSEENGNKVLQQRLIELMPEESEENVFAYEWEDVFVLTVDMQKDQTAVVSGLTNWLSKEG